MTEAVKSAYDELYQAVNDDAKRKELEARDYLAYLIKILHHDLHIFVAAGSNDVNCLREDPGRSGRLDLAIVADVREGTGETRRKAFLWEIKAPQLYAFVMKTKHRAEPSRDLFEAENQLFHYHNDKMKDYQFLEDNRILGPDDVELGGIVIGRFDRRIQAPFNVDQQDREIAFRKVINLRRRYIYKRLGMEVLTWTNILERIKEARTTYDRITDVFSDVTEESTLPSRYAGCVTSRLNEVPG
jgi:hypothetical protein